MIKEVYKSETKSKNKASFNSIVRLFAAAEDVAEQFLRIKMDRYAVSLPVLVSLALSLSPPSSYLPCSGVAKCWRSSSRFSANMPSYPNVP